MEERSLFHRMRQIFREEGETEEVGSQAMKLIRNIVRYLDKDAKDIMTHRRDIVGIDEEETLETALKFMLGERFSRFPVYREDIDEIIGTIHLRDAMTCYFTEANRNRPIKELKGYIRPVDYIPETKSIDTLFRRMQEGNNHIAIVIDEYGQTSGIVAMEDILEEIVGNIEDEHDQEEKMIEKLPDGSYLMDGMTSAEEALEILKIHIPEEDEFETLNGILISLLDRIPNDDEKFETDAFGYHFEVLQVENKMIKKVKITKLAEGVSTDKEENSCQKEETVLE